MSEWLMFRTLGCCALMAAALPTKRISSISALLDPADGSTALGLYSAALDLPGSGKVLWLAHSAFKTRGGCLGRVSLWSLVRLQPHLRDNLSPPCPLCRHACSSSSCSPVITDSHVDRYDCRRCSTCHDTEECGTCRRMQVAISDNAANVSVCLMWCVKNKQYCRAHTSRCRDTAARRCLNTVSVILPPS